MVKATNAIMPGDETLRHSFDCAQIEECYWDG